MSIGSLKGSVSLFNIHQQEWDDRLQNEKKDFLFLRPDENELGLSVQYWSDECLVYTKEEIGKGASKVASIAIDPIYEKKLVRLKPQNFSETSRELLIKEANLIDSFKGQRGIVQNYKTAYYPGRKKHQMRFHIIQELYTPYSPDRCRGLTAQTVNKLVLDLLHGLTAIHAKSLLHNDLKQANLLIKIDPKTNCIDEIMLTDLGNTSDGSNFVRRPTIEEFDELQRQEVRFILGTAMDLHRASGLTYPPIIDSLYGVPPLPVFLSMGMTPAPTASAKEALEAWVAYSGESNGL